MRIPTQHIGNWKIAALLVATIAFGVPQLASAQITHIGDVRIDGSLDVGFDSTGTSFGFDTLRLKENNLRLFFDDTSNSASFPDNDWRLVANDSSNGGAEYFAIEDATSGRQVFRVLAGAPSLALNVDAQGDVGIGETNPATDLHIQSGNTPTVRLEQDGTSGFSPQTWDLAGNETNFFIRDVTNSSKLPFRIRPDAPTSSIDIEGTGDVGFGTGAPAANIHVLRTTGDAELRVEASNATTAQARFSLKNSLQEFQLINNGNRMQWFDITNGIEAFTIRTINGRAGFRQSNPFHPIHVGTAGTGTLGNGAHLTEGGIWTDGSTRASKKEIADLDADAASKALDQLNPVTYSYKNDTGEKYVGFIAEDVPELVAMNDRTGIAAMEIAALVTKVVQEQKATIESQKQVIADLVKRVENLEATKAAE